MGQTIEYTNNVQYVLTCSGKKAEQALRATFEAAGLIADERLLTKIRATAEGMMLNGEFPLQNKDQVDAFVKNAAAHGVMAAPVALNNAVDYMILNNAKDPEKSLREAFREAGLPPREDLFTGIKKIAGQGIIQGTIDVDNQKEVSALVSAMVKNGIIANRKP